MGIAGCWNKTTTVVHRGVYTNGTSSPLSRPVDELSLYHNRADSLLESLYEYYDEMYEDLPDIDTTISVIFLS